jgi:GT2 family glycosyltransferase
MNNPLISIVLVNFNGFEDTVECIKSIMNIEYDNYNVIVVDNGSTTKPDVQALHFIQNNSKYIRLDKNLGFSGGNNVGIEEAIKNGADYILLLNNDTVVSTSFLDVLVSEAKQRNNNAIVTGKIYYFSNQNEIWYGGGWYDFNKGIGCHERNHTIDDFSQPSKSRNISFATGCMMLVPVSVIKEIGELEESFFLYAEDTEYCLRALKNGIEIVFCENAIIYHKVSRSTTRMSTPALYYLIRNSIRVAKEYSHTRISALSYWALFFVKRAIKKELPFSIGLRAYIAGLKDEKGPIKL